MWYLIWKHSSWRESNLKFKDHFWLLLWCYDVIFTQNRGWMEFKLKMGICYKAYHMMHHSTELFVLNQFMTFRDHFRVTLVAMTQCLIQVNLVTDHQCVNLGHNWERKALITICFSVFFSIYRCLNTICVEYLIGKEYALYKCLNVQVPSEFG